MESGADREYAHDGNGIKGEGPRIETDLTDEDGSELGFRSVFIRQIRSNPWPFLFRLAIVLSRFSVRVILLVLAIHVPFTSFARLPGRISAPSRITLATCRLAGWSEDVLCGTLEVFENRKTLTGRKIALRIVVLPSRNRDAKSEPVFYFAGGPGGSAVETVTRAGSKFLEGLRRDHDLVFVDQRGTGGSNALPCDLTGAATSMAGTFAEPFPIDRVREGLRLLEGKADLTLYSTAIAMADLDDVRAGLGYDRINLYGGSYGSTAALTYIKLFGQHVRSATLIGVAPPEAHYPLPISRGFENAMRVLDRDCAADEACRKEGLSPVADLKTTVARLERGPVEVETANPVTLARETVTVSRDGFVDLVRLLLYSPDYASWLPVLLHQTAAGEFGLFASVAFKTASGIEASIARGMHLCVFCAEDVDVVRDVDARRETGGRIYDDFRLQAMRRACAVWPHAKDGATASQPVSSNVPVLMLVGEADPVAPPWLAEAAAKRLPNSHVVVVPHGGHGLPYACVDELVAAFVAKGTADGLDVGCVAGIRRPPFVTGASLKALAKRAQGATVAEPIAGEVLWHGTLDVGTAKLRLVLRVGKAGDGTTRAVVDSPDQGAMNLPVDGVSITATGMKFEMRMIGATFEGSLNADGTIATGTWYQSGRSWPLVFTKKP